MKRFYPRVTEENQSFFVSPEYIKPYEIDGVLTAPLAFEQSFYLKEFGSKPYSLYHVVLLEQVHLFIPNHGVVKINTVEAVGVMNELRGEHHHLIIFTARVKLPIPEIENAFVTLHIHGALSLFKSLVDFDCFVISHEGLKEAPIALGYDLVVYDKE